jgi:hypothetical protein
MLAGKQLIEISHKGLSATSKSKNLTVLPLLIKEYNNDGDYDSKSDFMGGGYCNGERSWIVGEDDEYDIENLNIAENQNPLIEEQ